MAERVVDDFEIVDIHQGEGERLAFLDEFADITVQATAIQDLREAVFVREFLQLVRHAILFARRLVIPRLNDKCDKQEDAEIQPERHFERENAETGGGGQHNPRGQDLDEQECIRPERDDRAHRRKKGQKGHDVAASHDIEARDHGAPANKEDAIDCGDPGREAKVLLLGVAKTVDDQGDEGKHDQDDVTGEIRDPSRVGKLEIKNAIAHHEKLKGDD